MRVLRTPLKCSAPSAKFYQKAPQGEKTTVQPGKTTVHLPCASCRLYVVLFISHTFLPVMSQHSCPTSTRLPSTCIDIDRSLLLPPLHCHCVSSFLSFYDGLADIQQGGRVEIIANDHIHGCNLIKTPIDVNRSFFGVSCIG